MAEVLSPIIPHNDTISSFQNRSASSDVFHNAMSGSQNHTSRPLQIPRGQYNNHSGSLGYRGTATPAVAPYAFKATPALRNDTRSVSAPIPPSAQPLTTGSSSSQNRQRYPAPESISTISSVSSADPSNGSQQPYSKDDALLFTHFQPQPLNEEPHKSSPERYRRGHRRAESSVGSVGSDSIVETAAITTAQMGQIYHNPQQVSLPSPTEKPSVPLSGTEAPKRYRYRYSVGNMETGLKPSINAPAAPPQMPPIQNTTSHDQRPSSPVGSAQRPNSSSNNTRSFPSADAVRRINNPSPLSKPITATDVPRSPTHRPSHSQSSQISQSPAVAAMSALTERDANKGVKSRLRRAFSFGSAQELRRSSEADLAADRAKARREQFSSEIDDEQEAIAQRQEATGLGNGIYTSHSATFTGSTDNLSISSTASSASMMLRKMGNGMRKGGRSLKGLFRPKSVVGVPSADAALQASVGSVTLVNVEAEREQINVNTDPHDHPGGGTGFPKLEQNSLDVGRGSTSSRRDSQVTEVRRSIVGGDAERAEVMSAVKRGILKPSNAASPLPSPGPLPGDRPFDRYSPTFGSSVERHASPAGSTASSEPRRSVGHRRTDSSTLEGDDYFASLAHKFSGPQSSKSLPGTPRGIARNISFSPRIQFHDVWSSSDYDRRGDIATCNRLTPLLAQQIKEELNTFKMEMEVHELSKPHTHFF